MPTLHERRGKEREGEGRGGKGREGEEQRGEGRRGEGRGKRLLDYLLYVVITIITVVFDSWGQTHGSMPRGVSAPCLRTW